MTLIAEQTIDRQEAEFPPIWSRLSLIRLSGFMLAIAVFWRITDVLILGLGDTWINILPSKLGPLLIMLFLFMKYRSGEVNTALGINSHQLKSQSIMGLVIGLSVTLGIDLSASVIYAIFIDPTFPLVFHTPPIWLLSYSLLFFFVNAVLEEVLFRGLLQNGLKKRFSVNAAILFSAVVFGVWHVVWPIVNYAGNSEIYSQIFAMVLGTTIMGVLFGIYYERFSSGMTLTGPIIAHTLFNFLNESVKVGPEPAIPGPDMTFANPTVMIISLILFMIIFPLWMFISWKYKIEDVESFWNHNFRSESR